MLLTPGLSLPLWSVIPFIILFIFYLALIRGRVRDEEILEESSRGNLVRGIFWFLLGCVALYSGGELVVRNAVNLGPRHLRAETDPSHQPMRHVCTRSLRPRSS
jgi:Ca2+/Na+ antiporter